MQLVTKFGKFFVEDEYVINLLEPCRNLGRDKLCKFDDAVIKKFEACYWEVKEERVKGECIEFLKGNKEKISIIPFLTLPYSFDDQDHLQKIHRIWSLFKSQKYLNSVKYDDVGDISLPSGCMHPKYAFVGEAPSRSRLPKKENSYYNTFTRIYTQGKNCLLFRILSNIVFDNLNWYTNIFKIPLYPEEKIRDERLESSLKTLDIELQLLRVKKIICLGNLVYDNISNSCMFDDYEIRKIFHPSYIMRMGNNIELYEENMRKII